MSAAAELLDASSPDVRAVLRNPTLALRARDDGYPLPRTDCGVPYFAINTYLICCCPGWSDWQARREMAEIIPHIDAFRAREST